MLDPIRPKVLATRFIPNAPDELLAAYGLSGDAHPSLALITCDQDDSLYVALDEATKQAPVDVVFARSLYAGAAHASGPLSGEILGILGGVSPADVREGLAACVRCLEQDACFYTANPDGSLAIFPHVVHSIGGYLAAESGLEVGAPLAYLIAPPLEAVVGVDAALKAADVRLVKNFAAPTETNFGGAYLTGSLEQCEAAAVAFAESIVAVGQQPRVL